MNGTRRLEGRCTSARWAGAAALAACAGVGAVVAAQVAVPLGSWVWETVDERRPPAEFPPGSGWQLTEGTLELRPGDDARDPASGRFVLGFTLRGPDGTTTPAGVEGQFVAFTDSLHFLPDGSDPALPVRFRYRRLGDGRLALTDAEGRVWVYGLAR